VNGTVLSGGEVGISLFYILWEIDWKTTSIDKSHSTTLLISVCSSV